MTNGKEILRLTVMLLKCELFGKALSDENKSEFSDENLKAVYSLAKSHDLAHIAGLSIFKNNLTSDSEISLLFKKQISLAAARAERINYEYREICSVLEGSKIPYIPLKGAVIKKYYPQQWLRTSCDIDILVAEKDVNNAAMAIESSLEYTEAQKHYHDLSMLSPGNVNLELHFSLSEGMKKADPILNRVWKYSKAEDDSCLYNMSAEFLIFHTVAHAAYHFMNGGCGIKPLIDLKILTEQTDFNRDLLQKLYSESGLTAFAEHLEQLADLWFGEGKINQTLDDMQIFIARAGSYGILDNSVAVNQIKSGGRIKYMLSRIWLPFDSLKTIYPFLEKRKLLYPWYQLKRWLSHLFGQGKQRGLNELSISNSISKKRQDATKKLMKELELL